MAHRVAISNVGRVVDCPDGATVLEAALAAGVDYPYLCATGNCGACASRLEAGEVSMLPRNDAALSQAQAAAGQTLACRARPLGDVTVAWLGRGGG